MHRFAYDICFDDVDAAGIVYYPRFFHFCHLALEACFNEKGPMTYAELIYERRLGLPIVKVLGEYKIPVVYGDKIAVEIALKAIKSSSIITRYQIFKQGQSEMCFEAEITTVCIDLETMKSTLVPEDLRRFFDAFKII